MVEKSRYLRKVDPATGEATTLLDIGAVSSLQNMDESRTINCYDMSTAECKVTEISTGSGVYKTEGSTLCCNGQPPNTIAEVMMAGVNYKQGNTRKSVLFLMLLEGRYGNKMTNGNRHYYQFFTRSPTKLVALDISDGDITEASLTAKWHASEKTIALAADDQKFTMRSMSAVYNADEQKLQVWGTFAYGRIEQGHDLLHATCCPEEGYSAHGCHSHLSHLSTAHRRRTMSHSSSSSPRNHYWKEIKENHPSLMVWTNVDPGSTAAPTKTAWPLPGVETDYPNWFGNIKCTFHGNWNGQYGGGNKYYMATAWANSRVQGIEHLNGGVLFTSADVRTDKGCHKIINCDDNTAGETNCPTFSNTIHSNRRKSHYPRVENDLSHKYVLLSQMCSVAELATFTGGKLQRKTLAVRRVVSKYDPGFEHADKDIMGSSNSILYYQHSDRSYLTVAHGNGLVEMIDATEGMKSSSSQTNPNTALTPAVTQEQTTVNLGSVVVTAVEGTNPRMILDGTDAYFFTSFMRMWKVDLSQYIPCGNLLRFVRPNMKSWTVNAGSTGIDTNSVCLRSALAAEDSATVPWTCTAMKKVANHGGVQMAKNSVCCVPEDAPAGAMQSCCVEKIASGTAAGLSDALAIL
jgi:hypothetical protein